MATEDRTIQLRDLEAVLQLPQGSLTYEKPGSEALQCEITKRAYIEAAFHTPSGLKMMREHLGPEKTAVILNIAIHSWLYDEADRFFVNSGTQGIEFCKKLDATGAPDDLFLLFQHTPPSACLKMLREGDIAPLRDAWMKKNKSDLVGLLSANDRQFEFEVVHKVEGHVSPRLTYEISLSDRYQLEPLGNDKRHALLDQVERLLNGAMGCFPSENMVTEQRMPPRIRKLIGGAETLKVEASAEALKFLEGVRADLGLSRYIPIESRFAPIR